MSQAEYTLTKDLRTKKKGTFPEGAPFTISFDPTTPSLTTLHFYDSNPETTVVISTQNLPDYCDEIEEAPDHDELHHAVMDGVCRSVLGNDVEPDGWDHEGSPSWLLAMGLI